MAMLCQTQFRPSFLLIKFDKNPSKFPVKCFGESDSLKIKLAEDDKELMEHI